MLSQPEALWHALVWIALAGQIGTVARLWLFGLLPKYRWFACWALASALKSGTLSLISIWYPLSSHTYALVWRICEALTAGAIVFAGVEAYRQMAHNYPSIGSYGRKVFAWASTIALGIALLPFSITEIERYARTPTWLIAVIIRTATISVGVGLTLSIIHFHVVPISERNNPKINRVLMILYCAGQAIGMGLLIHYKSTQWTTLHLLVTATCWSIWPFALARKGEFLDRPVYTDADRARIEERWREVSGFLEAASGRQHRNPSQD